MRQVHTYRIAPAAGTISSGVRSIASRRFGPEARNTIAQGKALGRWTNSSPSPERAQHFAVIHANLSQNLRPLVTPLQGLAFWCAAVPGRCPGLSCCSPFGAKSQSDPATQLAPDLACRRPFGAISQSDPANQLAPDSSCRRPFGAKSQSYPATELAPDLACRCPFGALSQSHRATQLAPDLACRRPFGAASRTHDAWAHRSLLTAHRFEGIA